ncbi:MAG TPA: hypothetical protein VF172_02520 [Nitrososphaera sp.]
MQYFEDGTETGYTFEAAAIISSSWLKLRLLRAAGRTYNNLYSAPVIEVATAYGAYLTQKYTISEDA